MLLIAILHGNRNLRFAMALYLVTGGAGFIGSHLVDRLLDLGHRVRIIDNLTSGSVSNIPGDVEFVQADIRDAEAVTKAFQNVAGCFHLAAIASVQKSIEAPRETSDTNIMGTVGIFEEACRADVPVVYASSAAIYGANNDLPLRENATPQPLSPYASDKLSNELLAQALGAARSWPSFGLRFFNVYGPRQNPHSPYSGVVSIFLQRAIDGKDLVIYGDGGQSRDFIHVSDVTRFLVAAMEKASASAPVANVCTGRGTSVLELGNMLIERHGNRIVHESGRPGDIRQSLGSPELAMNVLGVQAEISFQDGLTTLW
jgi:UDP-glucose 4-epimerase